MHNTILHVLTICDGIWKICTMIVVKHIWENYSYLFALFIHNCSSGANCWMCLKEIKINICIFPYFLLELSASTISGAYEAKELSSMVFSSNIWCSKKSQGGIWIQSKLDTELKNVTCVNMSWKVILSSGIEDNTYARFALSYPRRYCQFLDLIFHMPCSIFSLQ
jgi:hypothetical protein